MLVQGRKSCFLKTNLPTITPPYGILFNTREEYIDGQTRVKRYTQFNISSIFECLEIYRAFIILIELIKQEIYLIFLLLLLRSISVQETQLMTLRNLISIIK